MRVTLENRKQSASPISGESNVPRAASDRCKWSRYQSRSAPLTLAGLRRSQLQPAAALRAPLLRPLQPGPAVSLPPGMHLQGLRWRQLAPPPAPPAQARCLRPAARQRHQRLRSTRRLQLHDPKPPGGQRCAPRRHTPPRTRVPRPCPTAPLARSQAGRRHRQHAQERGAGTAALAAAPAQRRRGRTWPRMHALQRRCTR